MKAIVAALALGALGCHVQAATRLPPTADALADVMRGSRVVLLGEVHDNAAQHDVPHGAKLKTLVVSRCSDAH